ncbi:hypothetical protein B0A49_03078 [Cryomyces minteri]|uniref:Ribonuclease P/MRP protein subunit POP5 n=1 Tax=Cryomyces minteri TaxID=331657 RepID=A0A4U0WZG7_9PEZI|nr:hypothetical protein B0A49_03078 [Cryomyces minteri]
MVRLKNRYLLINILYPSDANPTNPATALPDVVQFRQPSSDALTAQLLTRMVREGVAELFGDYGAGMVAGSLVVKYLSPATSTAIIRVARAHYRLVWAALTCTTQLPRPVAQSCVVQVVRVSGTIRKAEEEAIRRARASVLRARRAAGGDGLGVEALLGGEGVGTGDGGEDKTMEGIESEDEEE